jgi:hypothetical protein
MKRLVVKDESGSIIHSIILDNDWKITIEGKDINAETKSKER